MVGNDHGWAVPMPSTPRPVPKSATYTRTQDEMYVVVVSIWPAAAVIPAPIAYIKVAAVKKLVVGFLYVTCLALAWLHVRVPDVVRLSSPFCPSSFTGCAAQVGIVYFEQIRVFQAGRVPCIP